MGNRRQLLCLWAASVQLLPALFNLAGVRTTWRRLTEQLPVGHEDHSNLGLVGTSCGPVTVFYPPAVDTATRAHQDRACTPGQKPGDLTQPVASLPHPASQVDPKGEQIVSHKGNHMSAECHPGLKLSSFGLTIFELSMVFLLYPDQALITHYTNTY